MIVIWVFKFDEVNKAYFLLGMLAVFKGIGVISYLKYLDTLLLDSENQEFIIAEGVHPIKKLKPLFNSVRFNR